MSRKAFTLLELLIVVIIIGILVAIAIPQYPKTLQKARAAEVMSNFGSLRGAMDRYWHYQIGEGGLYMQVALIMGESDEDMDEEFLLDMPNLPS